MDIDADLELRHLRYFVTVAEELHFGRAALRLHMAQPPLSQQIRRLESVLGYPVFVRTSRSVRLTEAGEAFLERAKRTLRNLKRDVEETQSLARGEVGSLHVGFVGSGMLSILPRVFREYREAYPRVRLHLHESFTSRVVEGLTNGTLDAGILRDGDPAEGLRITPIREERLVAVLSSAHRLSARKRISPGALRGEPFVYYPRSAGERAYEKPLALFEAFGFRPQVVQEASHWLSILRLVGAGFGVSVAPECVSRIGSPEVVCLPMSGTKVTSTIELACHDGESRPIVQGFARIALRAGGAR